MAPVEPSASPDLVLAERWLLISHVPQHALATYYGSRLNNYLIAAAALAALIVVASLLIARHWTARRQVQRAVRESEAQFRALIESAPDAVVVISEGGTIELANAEAERMFGYRRTELLGQSVEILVPERFRDRHVGHRHGYVAAPRVRPMGAGLDLTGRRKDGSEFPVAISLSPIRSDGRARIFCDIRDTTEQEAAERQIQELNERLQRDNATLETVNKELEAFSYSVSHDLRTPLRAIDGFTQALQEDYGHTLDEIGQGYLRRVRQAAQRMGMLIDDMLKLARVSRTELSIADIDLSAMARDILNGLADHAPDRPVNADVEPGLTAQADARLMRVALENLLGNAWKFTAGRSPAQIAFGRAQDEANGAVYYVQDNGAGFDMAYSGKLFGAFQRLHDTNEFPGTGIGLATVQRIIHKHGGRIWAEGAPGEGATFRFTL
jgi:PAS domain S-box-containing protein